MPQARPPTLLLDHKLWHSDKKPASSRPSHMLLCPWLPTEATARGAAYLPLNPFRPIHVKLRLLTSDNTHSSPRARLSCVH
jgi:hypothetical protein